MGISPLADGKDSNSNPAAVFSTTIQSLSQAKYRAFIVWILSKSTGTLVYMGVLYRRGAYEASVPGNARVDPTWHAEPVCFHRAQLGLRDRTPGIECLIAAGLLRQFLRRDCRAEFWLLELMEKIFERPVKSVVEETWLTFSIPQLS
jgi:hypothetical protein